MQFWRWAELDRSQHLISVQIEIIFTPLLARPYQYRLLTNQSKICMILWRLTINIGSVSPLSGNHRARHHSSGLASTNWDTRQGWSSCEDQRGGDSNTNVLCRCKIWVWDQTNLTAVQIFLGFTCSLVWSIGRLGQYNTKLGFFRWFTVYRICKIDGVARKEYFPKMLN